MASRRRLRRRSCGEKASYASEDEAREAVRQLGRKGGTWLRQYRCRFCRRWHLGHTPHETRRKVLAGER
jgi:hypothetical protein